MAERKPLPIHIKLTTENVCQFKNVDCKFYEQCLFEAADNNWSQFHCRECQAYEPIEEELEITKTLDIMDESY
jgi:hypothetical protein